MTDHWDWSCHDTIGEDKPRHGYGARISVFAGAAAGTAAAGTAAPSDEWSERLLAFTWTGLDPNANVDLSQLYTLHLEESPMRWSSRALVGEEGLTAGGMPPPSQAFSICTADGEGSHLVIFGGTHQRTGRFLRDLHVLHVAEGRWIRHTSVDPIDPKGQAPCARAGHSMTRIGRHLYVYGGLGSKKDLASHQLFARPAPPVYRLAWPSMVWDRPVVSGAVSAALGQSAHGACAVGSHLVIFGGMTKSRGYTNAFAILNTATMCWSQPKLHEGVIVPPRAYPILEYDQAGHLLIFGGLGRLRHSGSYQQSDYKADLHRIRMVLTEDPSSSSSSMSF